MKHSLLKSIAATLLSYVILAPAHATPTTWTFTGIVQEGYAHVGQIVTGSLTIDFSVLTKIEVDGDTHQNTSTQIRPPYVNPLPISGNATVGDGTVNVGGGTYYDSASVQTFKNWYNMDAFRLYADSFDGNTASAILLETYIYTDGVTPSGIFDNTDYTNPDLNIYQNVHWFTPDSYNDGYIYNWVTGLEEAFNLTSLTITSGTIPEPGTISLLSIALCVFAITRRRLPRFA